MGGCSIVLGVVIMRRSGRVFAVAVAVVLLFALCFTTFLQFSRFSFARAASSSLSFVGEEYANGTITKPNSGCSVWYDWVNASGTQVINYAICDDVYRTPIENLLGQHLQLEDGSDVFVASGLGKFEVYHDLNGDGIPQADFTSGESEILYYMFMNMSDTYNVIPIQKVTENGVPHYQWGFTYVNAYAYLLNPVTPRQGLGAGLIFDHITFTYDFSVDGNISNLKTNFDIGGIVSNRVLDAETMRFIEPEQQLSLDGLSLALLYTTATYASNPYSTSVNGKPYNSTAAGTAVESADVAGIEVGAKKAYDFVFGGNYTLLRGESNETHQTNLETYEAKAEAAPLTSLPFKIYELPVRQISSFRDELELAGLFGGSWPEFSMNYDTSALTYRICFPVWDGMPIQHDPVYVGYVYNTGEIPELPVAIAIFSLAAATLLMLMLAKKHKQVFTKAI
jgi:hypothetical protein